MIHSFDWMLKVWYSLAWTRAAVFIFLEEIMSKGKEIMYNEFSGVICVMNNVFAMLP